MTISRWLRRARTALVLAPFAMALHAEPITLTIATHYTDDQRAPLTACLRTYATLHPDITVVHRQLSFRDVLQTIFLSRIGGRPPDIYNLSTAWTRQLVDSGALAPPPPAVADLVRRAYLPNTVDAMTLNGRAWGIPAETDVYMLVYNKRLFAQAGIDHPPSNPDEWVADATRISKANRQGQLVTSGFSFGSSQNQVVAPFLTLLYSSGLPLFPASGTEPRTNLNTAAARSALIHEAELFRTRGAVWGTLPYQFPSGTLGMMIVPNWFQRPLHQGLADRFEETVGVAPIPGGPDWRTVQYGFFWAVDAASAHPQQAWDLLQWLNTPQHPGARSCVGNMLVALGGLSGSTADLAASTTELKTSFMQPFVDALSSGRALTLPPTPHGNEIEALMSRYLERAMLGVEPAAKALRDLDAGILAILTEQE